MEKEQELNLFLQRVDEFMNSQYILADIKIVNVLKSIAYSKTLLAIFENCLNDFDYVQAKKKYLVKNEYLSADKGAFLLPPSSRELLAFVFNVLMDVDSHRINLNEFINKYFYADGSFSYAYAKFMNDMIKPFKNSVTALMQSVIEGKVQDPVEALTEAEQQNAKLKLQRELEDKKQQELLEKSYADSVNAIRQMLLIDKTNVKEKVKDQALKEEILLVVDMFANAVMSEDKDAITFSFVAFKYVYKANRFKFKSKLKKIIRLLQDVYNGL